MTTNTETLKKQLLLKTWYCFDCDSSKASRKNVSKVGLDKEDRDFLNDTTMSVDENFQEDQSVAGNTPTSAGTLTPIRESPNANTGSITLEQLSRLLDTKLEEKLERHKKSIVTEIHASFESQINKAILEMKHEFTQSTNELHTEQVNIKEDISYLDEKIEKLENANSKLQREIRTLQQTNAESSKATQTRHDTSKKFVIYKLDEHFKDDENKLEKRIIHMFREVMNINLTGYIEEISRMGKYGSRRPILVELISKRMTKYILQNVRQFKNTGIYVTEFLDEKSLQEKRSTHERRSTISRHEQTTRENIHNKKEGRSRNTNTPKSTYENNNTTSAEQQEPRRTVGGTFRN